MGKFISTTLTGRWVLRIDDSFGMECECRRGRDVKLIWNSAGVLSFELYVLKSWDGNNTTYGPDRWSVSVEGVGTLLNTSLSNNFKAGEFDLSLQELSRGVRR